MRNKLRLIPIAIAAVILCFTAVFVFWWKGFLLPEWILWNNLSLPYGDGTLTLSDRCLSFNREENGADPVWTPGRNHFVQDLVINDIDRDGKEELIFLVWKHGSYGNHTPFWVRHNDIALRQHIFIYRFEEETPTRLRPIWMSSDINYEIDSIRSGTSGFLIVNKRDGDSDLWVWKDFGLKLAGDSVPRELKLVCAGDNLIHLQTLRAGEPYDYLYRNAQPLIKDADIAVLNLETILVADNGAVSNGPRFGTPLPVGEAVVNAGFDLVCLANNHTLDKGMYGIDTSIGFFEEKGLFSVGAHRSGDGAEAPEDSITLIEKNGIRLAFLSFTDVMNGQALPSGCPHAVEKTDRDRIAEALSFAQTRADAVIVYMHWGEEYSKEISDRQKELAAFLAGNGANVIIGSHPHILQETDTITDPETGKETFVYYSLGNLISGQDKPECQTGGLALLTIQKEKDGTVKIPAPSLKEIKSVL